MLRDWTSVLRVSSCEAKLLLTSPGGDLLKARLPISPSHPRALLTLLEGLALWNGERLDVVVCVGESSSERLGWGLFGDELYPGESPLVRYHLVHRVCPVRRLCGVGDFRALRKDGGGP